MSIAIHLSVYLRYLDSINRPLLQYIIEHKFNVGSYLQTIQILLVTCLYISDI